MSVYFLYQDWEGESTIKVGVSVDVEKRQKNLQTGNPFLLKLVGYIQAEDDFGLEAQFKRELANRRVRGEWYYLDPSEVLPVLMKFGSSAYVGKSGQSFKITGYDKDAIPQYAGVWEWGDLEYEECCPFCGNLGGIHFQDASQMYHCLACDVLTTFEECSPDYDMEDRND